MNDRALSGVIMVGAAAALAWAWLTGRLDKTIATVVGVAQGKPVTGSAAASKKIEALHGAGGARDPFRGEL